MRCCWLVLTTTLFCLHAKAQIPALREDLPLKQKSAILDEYIRESLLKSDAGEMKKASRIGIQLAHDAKNDTLLAKYEYRLGAAYRLMSDADSALFWLRSAGVHANKSNHLGTYVLTQIELSYIYDRTGQADSMSVVLNKLEQLSPRIDSISPEKAAIHNRFVAKFYKEGNYKEALSRLFQCISILEKLKDSTQLAKMLANVGSIYYTIKQEEKGLKYLHQSRQLLSHLGRGKDISMGEILFNIARANSSLNRNDSAIFYYENSIEIAKRFGHNYLLAFSYSGLGLNHSNKNEDETAERYLLQGIEISEKHGIKPASLDIYERLGKLYEKKKEYQKAQRNYQKAFDLASEMKLRDRVADQYQNLAKAQYGLGNFDMAYRYQQIYTTFKDSINSETSNKNIAEMEAKYQSEQKEQQIALFKESDKSQTLRLKNQEMMEYFLLVCLVLVIVIAFLFWRSYRIRQLLRVQQIRNQIAADLHDDIGSTISSIALSSELASKKAKPISTELAHELDRIGRKSRETVATLQETIWAIHTNGQNGQSLFDRIQSFANEELSGRSIDYTFEAEGLPKKLAFSVEVQKNIYLIFKEAITNIVKHARATSVQITLHYRDKRLNMQIADNGIGFDARAVARNGNGLHNFHDRAALLKGEVKIVSSTGNGTLLQLSVPLTNISD